MLSDSTLSSDAIIAVKITAAPVGCKLSVRRWRWRWREEKAGGGHVTTKIRLTATVAADRRGALHLPGYTLLTKLHHHHATNSNIIGPFSHSDSCSSRLISINHHIISLILPTYTGRYCLWVGGGGAGARPGRHKI